MNLQAEISYTPWSVSSQTIETILKISVCGDTDRGGDLLLMNVLVCPVIIIQKSRT